MRGTRLWRVISFMLSLSARWMSWKTQLKVEMAAALTLLDAYEGPQEDEKFGQGYSQPREGGIVFKLVEGPFLRPTQAIESHGPTGETTVLEMPG